MSNDTSPAMCKSISVLAKEFIDGFRKKTDLSKLDKIEIYDENLQLDTSGSLVGIYGFSDLSNSDIIDNIIGHSIIWKKEEHSVTDVMNEIIDQLQNEYDGRIKPISDGGLSLILNRIKP